jgi:xanthine/uracil permease
MVIGFNLAGVATGIYMPADRWMAIITMTAVILMAVGLRGFLGRIAIFLGLIVGYVLSWLFDVIGVGGVSGDRVNWDNVKNADWLGFPRHTADGLVGNQNEAGHLDLVGWHWPSFSITFALLALPAVIALVAENMGHVKAVAGMTGRDLDPVMGRAIAADGVGTVLTSAVGGSPTTTYAENIGVMAATRVYSTAAYFVAAIVAILLGFIPKFGAIVAATPGGVLAGITLVLYGMIGMLGAKIWIENHVNFADPVNLVPIAAGLTLAIGLGTSGFFKITNDFQLGGIALGTIVIIGGYHLARVVAPRRDDEGTMIAVGQTGAHVEDHAPPHLHDGDEPDPDRRERDE